MKNNELSAHEVDEIIRKKKYGKHHDGGGLYLVGSEKYQTFSWILRLYRSTITDKPRDMGLGRAGKKRGGLTLAEARERARQLRQQAADGIDPIEARRRKLDEQRADVLSRITFKEAATQYFAMHELTWKNAKHKQQWTNSLKTYAYHALGNRPAIAIDGAAITDALASIWTTKGVTARRVKGRIETVVQWVKDNRPPPQKVTSRVKHHGAVPFEEIPDFMVQLRERESISARALEFTILTAARTSEVIGAKWSEIEDGVWTIPAERMKAGKEHRVPLSERALAILAAIPREKGGEFVFPGAKAKSPLSTMTMLALLQGMSGNGYTVHGFRSSFRDWAGERSSFPREVIEHALAHQLKDKAEASYWRGTAFEKRRRLMEEWAKYCSSTPATDQNGKVVNLHGAA